MKIWQWGADKEGSKGKLCLEKQLPSVSPGSHEWPIVLERLIAALAAETCPKTFLKSKMKQPEWT